MSKRKKVPSDFGENRIHLVDSDVEKLPEVSLMIVEEEDEEEPLVGNNDPTPTWDDVKDSISWLLTSWQHVHGVKLNQSDLYSIMYTSPHREAVMKYIDFINGKV